MDLSTRFCLLLLALAVISHSYASNCPTSQNALSYLVDMCGVSSTQAPYSSPGCSMYRLCRDTTLSPQIASQLCDDTFLLNTVCSYYSTATDCMEYMTSLGSNAMSCMADNRLSLYNTSAVQSAVLDLCMYGSMTMPQCTECVNTSCPDPLGTLSSICLAMPYMSGCALWTQFCTAETASNVATLCLAPGTIPACVVNPSTENCVSYNYPDSSAISDISSICDPVPNNFPPGCSLWYSCEAGTSSKYCAPMTILATLCRQTPDYPSCYSYLHMCVAAGSVVEQCTSYPAVPSLPTLEETLSAINTTCAVAPTSACSQCSDGICGNPLSTLGEICQARFTPWCYVYEDWCLATNDAFPPYCNYGENPNMLNYFHQRFQDTILWSSWVPQTRGEYVGSIFAILGFGTVSIGLKTLKAVISSHFVSNNAQRLAGASAELWFLPSSMQLLENFIKAFIIGLSLCLDYFNMLVALTFNVGLFVAVVLGYVLGVIIFGHVVENYVASLSHHQGLAEKGDNSATVVLQAGEKTEMAGAHEV